MKLYELFDKPITATSDSLHGRTFMIDGDGPYEVRNDIKENSFYFNLDDEIMEWVDGYVGEEYPKIVDVQFYYKGSGTITGLNQPYKVLSTVIDITKKYASQHNADFATFVAKETEPTRVKLYHRMAKALGKDYRSYSNALDETRFLVKL